MERKERKFYEVVFIKKLLKNVNTKKEEREAFHNLIYLCACEGGCGCGCSCACECGGGGYMNYSGNLRNYLSGSRF